MHWSVTESPTAPWVVQQLRETFPFDDAHGRSRYLVLDRDTIFSRAVVAAIESMGLEATRTSFQSPWQKGVAERFVGTVRRDLLDHAIVFDDEHLRRLLSEYLGYYHELRRIRVYTKEPGHKADMGRPFVLPERATVDDLALHVHKDVAERLKFARIWGPHARFEGRQVDRHHALADRDVLELRPSPLPPPGSCLH